MRNYKKKTTSKGRRTGKKPLTMSEFKRLSPASKKALQRSLRKTTTRRKRY